MENKRKTIKKEQCGDEKEDKTMKMHTKIKSRQEASKRRGRFCIYIFKLAIILYFHIKNSQYSRAVSHGQPTTLFHIHM